MEGFGVGEDGLHGRDVQLVADGGVVDGVPDGRVDDFEGAVEHRGGVEAGGGGDGGGLDGVADAVRVEVGGAWQGDGLVVRDGVSVAVDHGVDAQGEEVLVEGGEDARVHDGAEGVRDVREGQVDGGGGEDSRGAGFVAYVAGGVEDEGEDVLVVGDGEDGLQHELAVADDDGPVGAVVGVLPEDAGVLLVHADDVGHGRWLAGAIGEDAGDVVYGAEAVAAEREVVGHDAGAGVA